MASANLPRVSEYEEMEVLEPGFDFPLAPTAADSAKLIELEHMARASVLYLKSLPMIVDIGQRQVDAKGGSNILYVYASPERVVMEQRTPILKMLEGRYVIDLPDYFQRAPV